jgi:glycosyltransferase involved in cell wall biosynthesis
MIKVDAYTQGTNIPSSRYRVRQYIPVLKQRDILINEIPSLISSYPPAKITQRPLWAMQNLFEHFTNVRSNNSSDLIILQREFLSGFCTLERMLRKPLIFDVDDAIYLNSKFSNHAKKISKYSNFIVCGNEFLADRFSEWNSNVEVVPTAVDLMSFDNAASKKPKSDKIVILWSGSSSGYNYLYNIEVALNRVLLNRENVYLKIVSDKTPNFKILNLDKVIFERWNEQNEFTSVANSDIGIMPLTDSEWSKGKCSFKLLCYMASSLPVVCSPYGMNKEVLKKSQVGYGCITHDDWYDALIDLVDNKNIRDLFGINSKKVVSENYSIDYVSNQLYNIITRFST